MSITEKLISIQEKYNNYVDVFADLLKKQFDIRVNLAILRILFRDESQDFEALELRMFEQDLEYFELEKIDNQLIAIQHALELLSLELETF